MEIDPSYTLADKSLSLIHKYKLNDNHIKTMEEKLTKNISEEAARRLNFALGKAYEDIGHYQKSFKFYEYGNKLYKKAINYNIKNEIKSFDKIKNFFPIFQSILMQVAKTGSMNKKTASRKISRISKKLN